MRTFIVFALLSLLADTTFASAEVPQTRQLEVRFRYEGVSLCSVRQRIEVGEDNYLLCDKVTSTDHWQLTGRVESVSGVQAIVALRLYHVDTDGRMKIYSSPRISLLTGDGATMSSSTQLPDGTSKENSAFDVRFEN